MRVLVAKCQVDYSGRLTSHLPMGVRVIMVKADGSVSIHADDGAYKPLNWMVAPCTIYETRAADADLSAVASTLRDEITHVWRVMGKNGDELHIAFAEILDDNSYDLGVDPGLQKDGVEAHLQALLADQPEVLGSGFRLVQREYPTAIGPVDLLCRDEVGAYVAVEVKRRGEIDGVEQLTRYLELLNRDPRLGEVSGIFAAQVIKPQARTLATDRGISCVLLDYDDLRGYDNADERLF